MSTSPMIMILPLKFIDTSLFPSSTFTISYVLLFAAINGRLIELTGLGPKALFFVNKDCNFVCWLSSLWRACLFYDKICYFSAIYEHILCFYCYKNCFVKCCYFKLQLQITFLPSFRKSYAEINTFNAS